MAGSLILNDDLLVLQRKGTFDIKDEYYETNFPGQFPNIRVDTDIFHFTGEDLRYSCEEYIMDSGKFVRTDGDTMTGNLTLDVVPANATEGSSQITLIGKRTGASSCATLRFINKATSSNRTQTIKAIAPVSNTQTAHLKIADRIAITEHGQILMSGGRHNICAINNGTLKSITDESWKPDQNIITDPLEGNSTRIRWDVKGGELHNSNGKKLLTWDDVGLYLNGSSATLVTIESSYARYTGDIIDNTDITNKAYVDTQDSKSIPLKGTRATEDDLGYTLEQDAVTGAIDFTEEGFLNATVNSRLIFKRNNSIKLTIGGTADQNVHLHNCDINFHDNKLLNVPDPDTVDQSNPDAKNAVPKRYIDDIAQGLQDQYDNIADITAPPGMINAYTGTSAPTGWFLCKGGSYKSKQYPKLHRALGGSDSDWQNNANHQGTLPNLGGRFLAQNGALNNSANTKPFGNSSYPRQYYNQKTSEPYATGDPNANSSQANTFRNRMVTANDGTHQHYFEVSKINAATAGGHYHRAYVGNAGSTRDHNGDCGFASTSDANAWGWEYKTNRKTPNGANSNTKYIESGGSHSHNIGFNKVSNNSNNYWDGYNLVYSEGDHRHYIPSDQWDSFTLPYTYTINWIIKHDNDPNP